ncbi:conserved hypothetical protein [Trichodesmium erythraeum IMS101]|uniref:G domain-containing protein n=1 Tax=Trichodesmium erythraeum (strain IMS101) TaxID=203124 RepID=Q10Z94_TRIEI|nr:hypothetical protein [Trichodesmium erythraeum GBRTRLIN201]
MGNICIIGPKNSGKTTYLAGLSYYSDYGGSCSKYIVSPLNDESRELKQQAEDTILTGLSFDATGTYVQSVNDLNYYSFKIEVKRGLFKPKNIIILNVRDYPGEIFENILYASQTDSIHEEFINECLMPDVDGCLLLFTEWENSKDDFYSKLMSRFVEIMDEHGRLYNYRLAVVMSKCERGEIWPGRIDPETDLFRVYLKKTFKTLKKDIPKRNLRFFALSTFGVLGRYDPRPNRVDAVGSGGRASTLRKSEGKSWKPYNLIEPLCWLNKEGPK